MALEEGKIYHIYNRGINGCALFTKEAHYERFLQSYQKHCSPAFDMYAYALMGNHFHLLVKVKDSLPTVDDLYPHLPQGTPKGQKSIKAHKQLGHCLNAYAQYFNRSTQRTGNLFESSFKRKEVLNNAYFTQTIVYIHHNPIKHGFANDLLDYPYTSYQAIQTQQQGFIDIPAVFKRFGGLSGFLQSHQLPVKCEAEWEG